MPTTVPQYERSVLLSRTVPFVQTYRNRGDDPWGIRGTVPACTPLPSGPRDSGPHRKGSRGWGGPDLSLPPPSPSRRLREGRSVPASQVGVRVVGRVGPRRAGPAEADGGGAEVGRPVVGEADAAEGGLEVAAADGLGSTHRPAHPCALAPTVARPPVGAAAAGQGVRRCLPRPCARRCRRTRRCRLRGS